MTIFGHHQRPLVIFAPDDDSQALRIGLHCVVVGLGEELVVEHPLREDKPVPLLLPELHLVRDGWRDWWASGDLALPVRVHVEEPDDLVGSDPSSERLSTALSCHDCHAEIREAVHDLGEEAEQGDLQTGVSVGVHSIVGLHNDVPLRAAVFHKAFAVSRGDIESKSGGVEAAGVALPLIDEAKLPQVLQEHDETLAHSLCAVVLAKLGEGELEEEGEALDETHASRGDCVEILEDEEPDLAGTFHEEELKS